MPEKNLSELAYTEWLENTLQCLINFPVKGILLCAITDKGELYKDSYNLQIADKDRIIGLLQRENTLSFLQQNHLINPQDVD